MSLLNRFAIRLGTVDDAYLCQRMTRQFRTEFPFVTLVSLREAAQRGSLHIAMLDGEIVGFVSYRACRDGWQTIYELCVKREVHGLGIGRALLYSVPAPIRLKTTVDNTRANKFYTNAGMKLVETYQPKGTDSKGNPKRPLNVYHLRILSILVQGNNEEMPRVARESGMAYGTRHIEKPRDWPFMVDIAWRKYDWSDYLDKVKTWQPVQAMVADYEDPTNRDAMLKQVDDLRAAGVLRVMVCPKFIGSVAHIPSWCIVAVSVPSEYAGFVPPLSELTGRRIHLLGGSPVKQREWLTRLNAVGRVISLDGNAHTGAAAKGVYWLNGKWQTDKEAFNLYALAVLSGRNIVSMMSEVTQFIQPGLL